MTILEKQSEIVKEFSKIEQWEDRYKLIIQMGKKLPEFPKEFQNEKFKVKGCQSTVYMHAKKEDNKIYFIADSDAAIVKGLIALLLQTYSGHSPEEIMQTPPKFLEELGLNTHLSQSRSNGLASMIKQMKLYAFALNQI
jgi:cysteine desulfuration protein SufE